MQGEDQGLLPGNRDKSRGKMPQAVPGEGQSGYWGKLHRNSDQALELPRAVVESPPLKGFNRCFDVAVGDMGYGGLGSAWGVV